jgi:hypothetical protein
MNVAALFVETGGCYFGLPGVDPWDQARDARSYAGPWPVVAHPPCERWGRFAKGPMTNQSYQVGADDGCFVAALRLVHSFGGVLEHPAHSLAWARFGLPKPGPAGWTKGGAGYSCEVEQGHYGHGARKKTWLYASGCKLPDLIWGPSEQRLPTRRLAERGYESARRCGAIGNMSHNQRQRTPAAFRDVLLSIAASAKGAAP